MELSHSDWIGIIGVIVGIIGIIVGAIGGACLHNVSKNKARNIHDSTVQQAQVINNGMDNYAVIRLSRETTQEGLSQIIKKIDNIVAEMNSQPKIHIGPKPPEYSKEGDLWIDISE